jgi:ComEC/Rec2-related protein
VNVRAPHALVASLCIGVASANVARLPWAGLAAVAVALAAAASLADGERRLALLVAAFACAGWWWGSGRLAALDRSVLAPRIGTAERTLVEVTAPARKTRYRLRVPVSVIRFGATSVHEPALLELPPGRAPPQGARVSLVATVEQPHGPEHGFDERTWLRRKGIHVVLRADRWRQVGKRGGLGGLADRISARMQRPLLAGSSGERRAVLIGIVLGDDQAVPKSLRDRFRASGLYHLLAVSGQNVALVAGGALILAVVAGAPRWLGHVAALAGIAAYVLAVGPQPSVLRAGVVGALGSFAWLAARQRDRWHFLLLAALVLLAWNPYALLDSGFELSFAAVAAIFTLVPPALRLLEGYPTLPGKLPQVLTVAAVCGTVTAPILWFRFHQIPLLTVPANALAEPAMPPLLALALIAACVDPVSPGVAGILAWLAGLCAAYIALCARLIGGLPLAQITSGRGALAAAAFTLVPAAYAWRRWQRTSSRST